MCSSEGQNLVASTRFQRDDLWSLEVFFFAWSSTLECFASHCSVAVSQVQISLTSLYLSLDKLQEHAPSEQKNPNNTLYLSGVAWHWDWAGFRPPFATQDLLHTYKQQNHMQQPCFQATEQWGKWKAFPKTLPDPQNTANTFFHSLSIIRNC